jgi:cytoskeleton protein RodZ
VQAIGDRLREARMRQKIDIADVEAATKIRAKYLRALENEEFGLLPGPTFVKTFLRTYAEYLGLDAQLLVEEYRVGHEPRGEEFGPIGATSRGRSRTRSHARGGRAAGGRGGGRGGGRAAGGRTRRGGPRFMVPGPAAVFGLVVVLLFAIVLVLGLTGENKNGGSTTPRQPAAASDGATTTRRKPSRTPRPAATVVRMRIAPQGPVYACIEDGAGKSLFGGIMTTARTFKAKRIKMNLGRSAVNVTINGKRLKIPQGSVPVGYDVTPNKVRPIPLGQRPTC